MPVRTETIRQRLAEHMSGIEIDAWMHRAHPALDGRQPFQVILGGDAEAVHLILDRMDAGERF